MMRRANPVILFLLLCACSSVKKVEAVRDGAIAPSISMAEEIQPAAIPDYADEQDTLEVTDAQGRKMILMRAVRDEDGEMVASDVISPVVVAARFRHVAERHGRVCLRFDVRVPAGMVESGWQLRLYPVLRVGDSSAPLQALYITGQKYRRVQLRGYQRYQHFLESIVSDSSVFIRKAQLEIFLRRNLPELYALRTDSSYVSDERFASIYGVTQEQAVRHYTDQLRIRRNKRREAMKDRVFARLVKSPIPEGLRLDSVVTASSGDMIYTYSHPMRLTRGVRKAEIFLEGELFEEDRKLCSLPAGEPLVFYISSLSSLAEERVRYLIKVQSRRVTANEECILEFPAGSSLLDTALGSNALEIKRISNSLEALLEDEEYDLDSIVVAASCSPEGSWKYNAALSRRRSESVCNWFSALQTRDSVSLEFVPRSVPENWEGLMAALDKDSLLSETDKARVGEVLSIEDPDRRERRLSALSCYRHIREEIYPHLRVVRFCCYRHRRGMVKDTIHTTVVDSVYMAGLQALRDYDYPRAVSLLGPYGDINSAVAYCAMEYNASAMSVLEKLPSSARSEYMMALLHARRGENRDAFEAYLRSCEMDPSFIHRGNLDPEISELKKKYQTNEE